MKNAEKNLAAIRARIEAAQRQGDKELLIELLMQEEEYQAAYETYKETHDNALREVENIRENYKIFESEMTAKLNELKTLKTQAKMAKLKENINSVNAKYTSKNNRIGNINQDIERAREIVNKKIARANAVESLNDANSELRIKKLDLNSARERAKARAEALLSGEQGFEELEEIAKSFDGVESAFAIQAGREIRVIVHPEVIGDNEAFALARDIAKKIEEELIYPGQIKVTVVRETRVAEYAK